MRVSVMGGWGAAAAGACGVGWPGERADREGKGLALMR